MNKAYATLLSGTSTSGSNVTISGKFSSYSLLIFVLTTSSGVNFQKTMVLPRVLFVNNTNRVHYIWIDGANSNLYWQVKYVSDTQIYSSFWADGITGYGGYIYGIG